MKTDKSLSHPGMELLASICLLNDSYLNSIPGKIYVAWDIKRDAG
jgi:hypothetical protein